MSHRRVNGSVMSSVDPEEEPYLEQELHEDTVRRMDPVEEIGHAHHQQHGEHQQVFPQRITIHADQARLIGSGCSLGFFYRTLGFFHGSLGG